MNEKNIKKILKLLDEIKRRACFSQAELDDTSDNSTRCLFYDIKTECDKILERNEQLKERVDNYIVQFIEGGK